MSSQPLIPAMPVMERSAHPESGLIGYRLACPHCAYDTAWCVSWMAACGFLANHFYRTHQDVVDEIRIAWGIPVPKRVRSMDVAAVPSDQRCR